MVSRRLFRFLLLSLLTASFCLVTPMALARLALPVDRHGPQLLSNSTHSTHASDLIHSIDSEFPVRQPAGSASPFSERMTMERALDRQGRAEVQNGLQKLQAQASPTQKVEAGRDRYQAEQYAEAAQLWQQAVEDFQNQGDGLNQAMTLSNLGLAELQLGNTAAAETAIATALDLIAQAPETDYGQRIRAQTLSAKAQLHIVQGEAEAALDTLDQAVAAYEQVEDDTGVIRSQLHQAEILQIQGLYRNALTLVQETEARLQAQPDSLLKAAGYRQLGNLLRLVGNLNQAETALRQSFAIADSIGSPAAQSAALLSLGNIADTTRQPQIANVYYQQAAEISPSQTTRLQALINQLSLAVEQENWPMAQELTAAIQPQMVSLTPSRTHIYLQIHFAQALMRQPSLLSEAAIADILSRAVDQSRQIQDVRAESYSLGYLGRLYEQNQQWAEATELTRQALVLAQNINADSIIYQWQWQLGRLFAAQNQPDQSISAYRQAIATLQSLRSDLVAVNPEIRFSFREEVEPIYRELVGLLLKDDGKSDPSQDNLSQARNVIESLQVAELVNFFRADCVVTNAVQIDQVDTRAAVVYPIILPDRLEVVLSLPNRPLSHHTVTVPAAAVEAQLDQLRQAIVFSSLNFDTQLAGRSRAEAARIEFASQTASNTAEQFHTLAQQAYDWLIRPLEADLAEAEVQTLAFVLDGALRNVPMSVLYDGERYLIEKYAIALTPGLQLLDPTPIAERQVRAIVGGLSEMPVEVQEQFGDLPYVQTEVQTIQAKVPSEVLLNETFTKPAFNSSIEELPFPVVHLATHGVFSSNLEDTYVLTWNGRINANELSTLLQTSELSRDTAIELLVLSACETATGDDRAALGLAGIAVRSGARSTLATLWQVNDAATAEFMSEVYQRLSTTSLTKAEVLRQAQLALLQQEEYKAPYFWAPFVLVGNWL